MSAIKEQSGGTHQKLAWGLVLATALSCAALLVCLEFPASGLAHLLARLLPISDVAASDFGRDLGAAAKGSLTERPERLASALKDAQNEVRTAPAKPDAWLRLAQVLALSANRLTPEAAAALSRSYAVSPIDPSVAAWRSHFGLQCWTALTPALRRLLVSELQVVWDESPIRRKSLVQAVTETGDPNGRAAGEAVLTSLGWEPGKS